MWQCTPLIPAFGSWKQEGQGFKTSLIYSVSLMPASMKQTLFQTIKRERDGGDLPEKHSGAAEMEKVALRRLE